MIFPAGQFVSVRSFLIAAATWYSGFFLLSLVTRFRMWHWPIGKDLDLSFLWGHHHLHLVSIWIISYSLLHRADESQQGRSSCRRLQFGFQFGLYHVVAQLSFLRSRSALHYYLLFLCACVAVIADLTTWCCQSVCDSVSWAERSGHFLDTHLISQGLP